MGSKCQVVHPVYKNVCDYFTGGQGLNCSTLEAEYGFDCTGCTCAVETGKCAFQEFQGHQVNCDYLYWSHGWYCEYLEKVGYDCSGCSCPDPKQCQIDNEWGTTCDYWVDTQSKLTGDGYTCEELEADWHMNCSNCQSCQEAGGPMGAPSPAPTAGGPMRAPSRSPTSTPTAPPIAAPTSAPSRSPTGSPSRQPTAAPSRAPTAAPTWTTPAPTLGPTSNSSAMGTDNATYSSWTLMLRQTAPYVFAGDEWTVNANDPLSDNFAILDRLEEFRGVARLRDGGAFAFKLCWPADRLADQVWTQSSDPTTSAGVTGYQPINVSYTGQGWGGLERGYKALLDGTIETSRSRGTRLQWYAVGASELSGGLIHGPANGSQGIMVRQVELWVKQAPSTPITTPMMAPSPVPTDGSKDAGGPDLPVAPTFGSSTTTALGGGSSNTTTLDSGSGNNVDGGDQTNVSTTTRPIQATTTEENLDQHGGKDGAGPGAATSTTTEGGDNGSGATSNTSSTASSAGEPSSTTTSEQAVLSTTTSEQGTEAEWVVVFRQTVPYAFAPNEWNKNKGSPGSENYATLDKLEGFRENGSFTFKLSWPSDGLQDQVWKQDSNPFETESGVAGYVPIAVPYTGQNWGGLEHGEVGTLLDGSINSLGWWYAVGAGAFHNGQIPGPSDGTIDYVVSQVELWARRKVSSTTPTPATTPAPEELWTVIFRQTVPQTFFSDSWAKNTYDPLSDNFAILDRLENFRVDGSFTFKLSWPRDALKDQIWMQDSNPVTTTTGGVNGYRPIDVPYTGQSWGGLEHGEVGTLLDGSINSLGWWYSVGAEKLHNGCIPGPANGSTGILVLQVELWVKQAPAAAPCPAPPKSEKPSPTPTPAPTPGPTAAPTPLPTISPTAPPSAPPTRGRVTTTPHGKDRGGNGDGGGGEVPGPDDTTTTSIQNNLGVGGPATATGDPHLVNIKGEHFDINHPGSYTLLRVPGDESQPALVQLQAQVESDRRDPCAMLIAQVKASGAMFDDVGGLLMRSMRRQSASPSPDVREGSGGEVRVRILDSESASPFAIRVGHSGSFVPIWEFSGLEGFQDGSNMSVKAVLTNQKPGGPWNVHNAAGFFKITVNGAVLKIRQKRPGWGFLNVELLHLDRLGTSDVGGLLGLSSHPDQQPSAECLKKRSKRQRRLAEQAKAKARITFRELPVTYRDRQMLLEYHDRDEWRSEDETGGSFATASLL